MWEYLQVGGKDETDREVFELLAEIDERFGVGMGIDDGCGA